ncbi:MAG: Motility protein B [Syntrophorhabdaceae bacterium PtaU1.Bin034]|jgi:chemotaxis protein MotB|nr:MAG: Motility protein B [Syntrophorhabdaceae bacterium PtaU1.Bin034]
MRRKKNDDEHENLERWLITYADLITLLLAFFIMMYTFSKQDAQKYQEVSGYLKTIFSGGSGFHKTGSGSGAKLVEPLPKAGDGNEIKRQLEDEIRAMADQQEAQISVFRDERGIVIRILDRAFFDEGRADLTEAAKSALKKIVPIIKNSNCQVRIEGHTDDVPIATSEFRSNWELSVRRATEVVRHLIEKYGFSPVMISASGYAEYRPVAGNDTPGNRALNRRIEIILLQPGKPETVASPLAVGSIPPPI